MRSFLLLILLTLAQTSQAVTIEPDVELHFALCDTSIEAIFAKLGITHLASSERVVRYSDTQSRDYFSHGLVVRHRSAKKGDETVVKIKIADIRDVDPSWFELENFKCETDRSLSSLSLNCSLGGSPTISQDQIEFIKAYGPPDFSVSNLKSFGPARDTTWKNYETQGFEIEFERYRFPSGDQIFEVSTRVRPLDADQSLKAIRQILKGHEVSLCNDQSSKTKSFFAHF